MLLPKFNFHEPSTLEEALHRLPNSGVTPKFLPAARTFSLVMKLKNRQAGSRGLDCASARHERYNPAKRPFGNDRRGRDGSEPRQKRSFAGSVSASGFGGRQIGRAHDRNRATIGGNLVNGRPAADFPPRVWSLRDGETEKRDSRAGSRSDGFLQRPRRHAYRASRADDLHKYDTPPPWTRRTYIKLGARKTLEISMVNCAALITLDKPTA